ncbi:hypothetical protein Malapachy_4129 [Malassezia pachydermatis]|uniref:Cytochrome c oxidase assembly protein n=1 Tax=Malassezia pachydermatis TaxID=77020 RepID=A0A0M9VPE0_9BASI|nr:hypothetical protein Malapachy_4129 [Malassezia pachydermatis]KOS14343.1 hypothetical protein Malapachy_4129 [Malassezia pachydermatis]
MSRAAKFTLGASIVTTVSIVTGVHYLQIRERQTMYKGVERDEQRQREKAQRMADLRRNQEREKELRSIQPMHTSPDSEPKRLA